MNVTAHFRAKPVAGASLGILVLDTRFPRLPGDIAHARTWPFPVQYKVVRGASIEKVVHRGAEGLLPLFLDAAQELVDMGVDGIATSCGFLSIFQKKLAEQCPVPVAASSLLQVPLVQRLLPSSKRVGVLTFAAERLSAAHLRASGAPPDTPLGDVPADSEFRRSLQEGRAADPSVLRAEVIAAAQDLVQRHPDIGALVVECTNMPAYSADLREHLGMPVYDIVSLVEWFHAGLQPRRFD